MNIKMVVTDLDGTLLREDKTISARNVTAFARLREKGIRTVYATGRGKSAVELTSAMKFDGAVRNNGASAYIEDEPIYKKLLSADSVRDLLIACDKADVNIAVECGAQHYANFNINDLIGEDLLPIQYEIIDFSDLNRDAEKLWAIIDSTNAEKVLDVIKQNLSDTQYLYATRDGYALVMHKDATKSKALASLADHWNIDKNEIVAFGDDVNDLDLLEYCGIGVATGNAIDEVKTVADQVCDTNENDGIAKWIEENLL